MTTTNLRRGAATVCLIATAVLAAACGKKGPPLPPLVNLPSPPTEIVATRSGDDVTIRFTVPRSNITGAQPANLKSVEVYAWTGGARSDSGGQSDTTASGRSGAGGAAPHGGGGMGRGGGRGAGGGGAGIRGAGGSDRAQAIDSKSIYRVRHAGGHCRDPAASASSSGSEGGRASSSAARPNGSRNRSGHDRRSARDAVTGTARTTRHSAQGAERAQAAESR